MAKSASKVILISGANSGIGFEIASRALEKGHKVIAVNRSISRSAAIQSQGAHVLELDAQASEAQYALMAKEAIAVYDKVDTVIINAGDIYYSSIEESSTDRWESLMAVNFWGGYKLARAFLPQFKAQNSGTYIFNSTQTHELGFPLIGAYNSSKAALTAFADTLRAEVKGYGVRVTVLQAGMIKTPFNDRTARPKTSVPDLQPIVEYMNAAMGDAPLDPVKGAERVLEMVDHDGELPERVPFGKQAYGMMVDKYTGRLADFKAYERWSVGLDFDGQ